MHCAMVSYMATHTGPPSEFIGSAEVARLLRINQVTVSRWVASGDLVPAHKLPGKNGAYLFKREDVDRVAADRASA
jgi:excisionase family DNA binding protein